MSSNNTLKIRFENKFKKTKKCWLWTAAVDSCGYGRIYMDGENQTAHRVSWVLYKGKIPNGIHVLHKCDVPNCVNPKHLFLGTHKDNMDDRDKKGRLGERSGENNGRSKLKRMDVLSIRKMLLKKYGQRVISKMFNVSVSTIKSIKSKRTWTKV